MAYPSTARNQKLELRRNAASSKISRKIGGLNNSVAPTCLGSKNLEQFQRCFFNPAAISKAVMTRAPCRRKSGSRKSRLGTSAESSYSSKNKAVANLPVFGCFWQFVCYKGAPRAPPRNPKLQLFSCNII